MVQQGIQGFLSDDFDTTSYDSICSLCADIQRKTAR
jgi:hypothetical protein